MLAALALAACSEDKPMPYPTIHYEALESYAPEITLAAVAQPYPARDVAILKVPDDQARAWMVTLAPPLATGANTGIKSFDNLTIARGRGVLGITAQVTWGIGRGPKMSANVDWGNGRQFVVFGSHVQVQVKVPDQASTGGGAISTLHFAGTIVPADDNAGDIPPPALTVDTGDLVNAAPQTYCLPVPSNGAGGAGAPAGAPWGRRLRWYSYKPAGFVAALALQIEFLDGGGAGVTFDSGTAFTTSPATWPPGGLVIPGRATWMRITNRGGGADIALMLEFELDL